jgi:hypothetical protein
MIRHLAATVTLLVIALPSSAFACGMYIPPEKEKMLTELMDDIDAPTVIAEPTVDVVAAITANESLDAQPAVADVIPELEEARGE